MTSTGSSAEQPAPESAARDSGATSDPAGEAKGGGPLGIAKRVVQAVVGIGLAAFLLGWVLPWLTHTSWSEILHEMARLGWAKALLLFAMMMAGLYCYTFTLSASLPGLKHIPALIVNLCGSGVSNSMPGGGAVGVAAQYAIFRSWGFSHRNIGTSLIITSIWNLLVRAILPLIAIVWLFASGTTNLPHQLVIGVWGAVGVATVMVGLAVGILASDKGAHAIGRGLDKVVRPVLRLFKRDTDQDIEAIAVDIRSRVIGVVRPGWQRLTFGIVGFLGIYFFLFRECMLAFGIDLPWPQAFACYALSRLLTMVPLTPGGIGVTELAALLMIAFGAGHAAALASVVLFAVYSHILEIPLGMLSAAAWAATRKFYYVGQEEGPDEGPQRGIPAFH
ncbi:lysylphosphatidylglycerol synthase transmembrane domain-containing protein [Austwickia sp. TVS 96-490-7B]|uniref:lysylphosphatidylglycerol synthase transmembrane domain-containing protein n=1 Tax=Austwickia sp. TVS 96-490-7B TaxID=2830843 RepID=UPI001C58176A|nr:lysylphosphatidylglycerol synthase transmembrane domain-containing protein [Austwickia sp. TVS 96-490-7B]